MIHRNIEKSLRKSARSFPIVSLVGPRQSGKTTLAKAAFPKKQYVSLENPSIREYALSDPKGFLNEYPKGAILDEIQRAPDLFSYIQTIADENNKSGMYVLTGSQHFLLMEGISQSLAGRAAIHVLLPFSLEELRAVSPLCDDYDDYIYAGFYPRIYDKKPNPAEWYANYIQTYVERDARLIKNVTDLNTFRLFLKMCAARVGQILNLSSLANDCGITHNTAKSWISILETSFIIFLLQPHHKNFNKRLIKMPKLYFFDPGLAASLLGIENSKQISTHHLKGGLFETLVLSELFKFRYNHGLRPNYYFWRDKIGHEVDCIIEKALKLVPVEIKSGKTASNDFFTDLQYWNKLAKNKPSKSYVIYGGAETQGRSLGNLIAWTDILALLENNL